MLGRLGGLLVAVGSALAPLAFGGTILETTAVDFTLWPWGEVHLVTSLFFDIGVYLIVVGLVLDILRSLGARLDLDDEDIAELRAVYVDATTSPTTAALRQVPGVDDTAARSDLEARRAAIRQAAENEGSVLGPASRPGGTS